MSDLLTKKEEEYVVSRLVALMVFEPQRWRFVFNTAGDYRLRYRRLFGRSIELLVKGNVSIELSHPSRLVFRSESNTQLQDAIERLRRVSEARTPAIVSALRALGLPKTAP